MCFNSFETSPTQAPPPRGIPSGWTKDRIARKDEETPCDACGYPLFLGDSCFRDGIHGDGFGVACGVRCAHDLNTRADR